jgi:hypothetical protein
MCDIYVAFVVEAWISFFRICTEFATTVDDQAGYEIAALGLTRCDAMVPQTRNLD